MNPLTTISDPQRPTTAKRNSCVFVGMRLQVGAAP